VLKITFVNTNVISDGGDVPFIDKPDTIAGDYPPARRILLIKAMLYAVFVDDKGVERVNDWFFWLTPVFQTVPECKGGSPQVRAAINDSSCTYKVVSGKRIEHPTFIGVDHAHCT
jgi:hypothetical protein